MFLIIWMSPVSMETNLVRTKPSGPTAFPVASPERWGSGSSAGDRKRYGRRFWWTGSVLMEGPRSDGLILIQNRNRNSPAAPSRPAAAGSGPRSCCPQTGPWRGRVCCRSAAEREREKSWLPVATGSENLHRHRSSSPSAACSAGWPEGSGGSRLRGSLRSWGSFALVSVLSAAPRFFRERRNKNYNLKLKLEILSSLVKGAN